MTSLIGSGRWTWRLGYFGVSVIALILDQITKLWVLLEIQHMEMKPVVPGIFTLTNRRNFGGAFGFLRNLQPETRSIIFLLIPATIALIILVWSLRAPVQPRIPQLGLALILGGAFGNLLDRLRHGFVVDFLLFHLGEDGPSWPAFNAADTFITIGVGLLIVQMFWIDPKTRGDKENPGS